VQEICRGFYVRIGGACHGLAHASGQQATLRILTVQRLPCLLTRTLIVNR
jgi:hypothetical protein